MVVKCGIFEVVVSGRVTLFPPGDNLNLDFVERVESLMAETIYITFLIYLKAIYGQKIRKMKEMDLSILATQCSIVPDRRS